MSDTTGAGAQTDTPGWGTSAWATPGAWTVSRWIGARLAGLGVGGAFGVLGGGIAPFAGGLRQAEIGFHHFRHEAGAGFAAVEAYFATGRPYVLVVTTGPGLLNVLNAVMAARVDGAKLVVVSGTTPRARRGRGAVQETSAQTMPEGVLRDERLFHLAAEPETPEEVQWALQRIEQGLRRPGGFVAHLALPWTLQTQVIAAPPAAPGWEFPEASLAPSVLDACLERLGRGTAALWVGHGALGAASELRDLAEEARLPVILSPRAKGLFDERHPLCVGTSGAGAQPRVDAFFARQRPDTLLVIGTRLGEVTSLLSPSVVPARGWVQVDVDPTAFGAAFPGTEGVGVVADARVFVAALLRRARETGWMRGRPAAPALPPDEALALAPRREGGVRPDFLMQALQRHVVEGSEAAVMSEAGSAFSWCNHALRFRQPGRYRTSAAWGSMGHFTTGCVGAAIATGRKAVAVVGDGSMLMNNEINTAVAYGAPAVWVVLNDAQLGLNEHGMRALGMAAIETQMPRTDFVAFARSQGAAGIRVEREEDLGAALDAALAASGPVVVDVQTDGSRPAPVLGARVKSLSGQARP